MLNAVLARIDQNQNAAIERLFALMRIPSISTDPAYAEDCTRAADWLVDDLTSIGFTATRHDTPGRPMVVARHVASRNLKTVRMASCCADVAAPMTRANS